MVHLSQVLNDKDAYSTMLDGLAKSHLNAGLAQSDPSVTSVYGSTYASEDLPRHTMPEKEMPREIAYRMIKDDLTLDGVPTLNLASFVTTYMEEEAEKLMAEAAPKNFIDYEEYPVSADIQSRCVSMIARLFNCPVDDEAATVGTSTIGSSEAIMLATLAMKKRWQNKRKAAGKPYDNPNIVMNSAVQVCWEKAARYFEVEERFCYCTPDRYVLDPEECVDLVDENTIGICTILGTTYTGEYEDTKAVNDLLVERNIDCNIHVDAASGGFVAPFVKPDLQWDFRLSKVISINVSGHKYGLVYPGVGWVVWRDPEYLPKELIFNINYLGADQASFTLNFSKGASQIIGQYYQMIRLGKNGYRAIMCNLTRTADYLSIALEALGFKILSKTGGNGLPLVAFRLDPDKKHKHDEFDIAHALRERGWVVPAYTMAPHSEKMKLMRVVVREDFSRSRCDALISDLHNVLQHMKELDEKDLKETMVAAWKRSMATSGVRKRSVAVPAFTGEQSEEHSLQGKHGKTHPVRTWLLLIFGVLAIFFLLKSYPTPTPTNLSRSRKARGVPRIKKVSMLYGDYNPLYERAIRSHNRHNEKFDYPFDVLRHDVSGGYWNKPSYLMSLVVAELAKPVEERVEWLMWVDADLVHINPSIPLEIFLPPHDFENVHYLGNKDHNGLNTGTFFLHVHEWSVKMLAKTIAFPMFRPDIDLHTSIDQEAMQHIFNESDFAPHVLFQPRPWYNTYEFHHGYEGKKGFMLVHFPGLEEDRWVHMNNWLDTVERHPGEWDVPWEETHYPKEIDAFWKTMREARDKLREAYRLRETLQNEDRLAALGPSVETAMDRVASVLLFESDQPETVEKAYQELKSALEARQSSTNS